MRTALVTGITGQDGAYLAENLLSHGYHVYGTYRRTSTPNFWRLEELGLLDHPHLCLREYDVTDLGAGLRLIEQTEPDEVYNLAAQTFVHVSFDQPITTGQVTGLGPVHLLEAIRTINPRIRYFQPSSAEMFGAVRAVPQDENTPFYPRSPYGAAKLYAHWMAINYREAYGIFTGIGILFNHESPLRGTQFVTRRISLGAARIRSARQDHLTLGNLDARRDWGYAREYVDAMRLILQAETPDTFVLATKRTETVRDFASLSFRMAGIELEWQGTGDQECGVSKADGAVLVRVDPQYYRPAEVDLLIGDPGKAEAILGWKPRTSLETLSCIMVEADLARLGATTPQPVDEAALS